MNGNILEMKGIVKSFGGVRALRGVDFFLQRGEVHALIGENGAGKSTLMKILSGAYKEDAGEIYLESSKIVIKNPSDAIKKGISVIYQEFMLAPDLTVAENIYIDKLTNGKKIINWKKINTAASQQLTQLGFSEIDPKEKISNLSVACQQVVEICKCLTRNSKILVFDEPTSVLTFSETQKLFSIIKQLKDRGVSIIYISHRLEEIFQLTDRITIFKDGANVSTVLMKEISMGELVTLMVGREISQMFPLRNRTPREIILKVDHLCSEPSIHDISFFARRGEILGFYGLVGAGRTEVMRAIFGADKYTSGQIEINGKKQEKITPQISIKLGLGMLPEDRKKQGLLLEQSVRINSSLATLKRYTHFSIIDKKAEKNAVVKILSKFDSKYKGIEDNVNSLSGGNQQKVALSKWVLTECACMIFDEPTRGVDVGAKVEIYKIIDELANAGLSVIVVSSEMAEVIGLCDRVIVMREGTIVGELTENITEQTIIKLAMGVSNES